MYDIIIIGAGVAGMTAAIYAVRAGKKVLVLEGGMIGGQIVQTHDVRNWPGAASISGENLTKSIYEQAKTLGAEFEFDIVKSVTTEKSENPENSQNSETFVIACEDATYRSRALIIATGSCEKSLGLPEEAKFLNHGLSHCATCDGALFKDRDIAVVGGGNTAFYDVLYLADLARRVYLVHHSATFRADAALVAKVKKLKNVEMRLYQDIVALKGEQELTEIVLKPSSTSPNINADDRPDSAAASTTLPVSGLFIAIGREPATDLFQKLVKTDKSGYIIADESGATSHQGIFVAGDCRTKSVRQLVTAASDGANAATSAVDFLNH